MKRESALRWTDKKYNTEFGILTDPKSPHRSSVVFHKLVSSQEPKFCIWEPPQELPFPTFQISLDQRDSSMLLSSHTESAEIWSTWPRRELTLSQLSTTLESHKIIDFWWVWSTSSSLMSPNQIKPESFHKTATCTWRTEASSWFLWRQTVSIQPTSPT